MDIDNYIESGILELYVAGALDPDEEQEVERLAHEHSRIRDEIYQISQVVEDLLLSQAKVPAPLMRDRITRQIRSLESTEVPRVSLVPPSPITSDGTTIPVWRRYLLAAAIVVAIASSATAGYFGYRLDKAQDELLALRNENDRMAADQGPLKARLERTVSDLALLRTPGTNVVELKGVKDSSLYALVVWNSVGHQLRIDPAVLPPPPEGHQYQLWAIADGKPVDAGIIPLGSQTQHGTMVVMKDISSAQAFAITIEPAGGSQSPTLDRMVVMGNT